MNAQDRLAAIVIKHQRFGQTYGCTCGWEWPETPTWACGEEERFERALAAHVAERVASADDLAVVELRPPTVDRDGAYWDTDVFIIEGDVFLDGSLVEVPFIAALAADLLAAVKAAEAVSDR